MRLLVLLIAAASAAAGCSASTAPVRASPGEAADRGASRPAATAAATPTRWFSESAGGLTLGAIIPADPADPVLGRTLVGLPQGQVYAFINVTNDSQNDYRAGDVVAMMSDGSSATFRPRTGTGTRQHVVAAHSRLDEVWVTADRVAIVTAVYGPRGERLGRVDG